MKTILALLASTVFVFADSPKAVIVLDASGSMWGQIEGKAKIEIARDVIEDLLADLPSDLELGLVAYGHRRKGDCEDIEMLIPPGQVDREAFQTVVDNIVPKGKTPLTAAVEFAAQGMNFSEERASVILVTDGLENCDRDPCATAQQLEKQGIDFTAHVVAFDLTAEDALTVECLAKETGGQFLPAGDAASLATALGMAVEDVVAEPKPDEEDEPAPEDPVTLTAPESVPAGSKFEVEWKAQGETTPSDFITVVPVDTEEGKWKNYSYSKDVSPTELTALVEPGQAEVRYLSGKTYKTLGRVSIELTEVLATLEAPEEAVAGSKVTIQWTGPGYPGDFITIVSKDTEEKKWAKYSYAKSGENTVEVACPTEAGACEIRYLQGQGYATLARIPLTVTEADATLSAPETTTAGAKVPVEWTGPMNEGDFITIVPKDTPETKWAKYKYATEKNQPAQITAPMQPGPAEIRYLIGQGYETLARADILIEAAETSLSAPEKAMAGSKVTVEWTGPKNGGDFITIVPKDTPETKWAKYEYATDKNQPAEIAAPMEAGPAEVRYLAGQGYETLARTDIVIEEAETSLSAPETAVIGSAVKVDWAGPDNQGDFITIVSKDTPDGKWAKYQYTNKGTPLSILAPMEPGAAEVRYIAGQNRETLARIAITLEDAEVTLKADKSAEAGTNVKIEWTGPDNQGDFITIVPKNLEEGKWAKYTYTKSGSPADVKAPAEAGDCEIRYLSGQNRKTLARIPIKITPSTSEE
jgi:Ca-activated chloride channel family protein